MQMEECFLPESWHQGACKDLSDRSAKYTEETQGKSPTPSGEASTLTSVIGQIRKKIKLDQLEKSQKEYTSVDSIVDSTWNSPQNKTVRSGQSFLCFKKLLVSKWLLKVLEGIWSWRELGKESFDRSCQATPYSNPYKHKCWASLQLCWLDSRSPQSLPEWTKPQQNFVYPWEFLSCHFAFEW